MADLTDISRQYPYNESHMRQYVEYQQKYAIQIRESDKVIIQLVRNFIKNRRNARVLDIGCSTGNLLKHLRNCFPDLELFGADLSALEIESCKNNSELAGISFEVMDITAIPASIRYDIVIANAILFALEDQDFIRALSSISRAMNAGGILLAFDFFHPWSQDVTIIEKSEKFPDGFLLRYRPYSVVLDALKRSGFDAVEISPFLIPIDLPRPSFDSPRLETYTVKTEDGGRLQFRGPISQPWAHLTARRI